MLTDRDFRKLPASTQCELRRVAVNMVLSGTSRIEVAKAVGVSRHRQGLHEALATATPFVPGRRNVP